MKTLLTDIEILRDLLSYDTEELKFLTFYERCEIHRNIAQIMKYQKVSFSDKMQSKLIEKVIEIRNSMWKRPNICWEENLRGEIVKIRLN